MGFIPEWAIGVVVIIVAASGASAFLAKFRGPARRLHSSDSEVGDLRQTVEALQARLAELEERVDFTERLLAKYREADRLESPPG
jgi:cell division protein FtsB